MAAAYQRRKLSSLADGRQHRRALELSPMQTGWHCQHLCRASGHRVAGALFVVRGMILGRCGGGPEEGNLWCRLGAACLGWPGLAGLGTHCTAFGGTELGLHMEQEGEQGPVVLRQWHILEGCVHYTQGAVYTEGIVDTQWHTS